MQPGPRYFETKFLESMLSPATRTLLMLRRHLKHWSPAATFTGATELHAATITDRNPREAIRNAVMTSSCDDMNRNQDATVASLATIRNTRGLPPEMPGSRQSQARRGRL